MQLEEAVAVAEVRASVWWSFSCCAALLKYGRTSPIVEDRIPCFHGGVDKETSV